MSYSSEVLADAPRAYYRLGESSGSTMVDSSGNSRNGTYVGSPTLGATGLLTGDADTAVALNGSSQYGEVAYNSWMDLTGTDRPITVEAIIKASSLTRDMEIVERRSGSTPFTQSWGLMLQASGTIQFFAWNSGSAQNVTTTSAVVTAGTRTHIVVTRSVTNGVKIYVNGAAVATTGSIAGINETTATLNIGCYRPDIPTYAFAGTIDEVAFYGTELTSTRVAAHYSAATTAPSGPQSFTGTATAATVTAPAGAFVAGTKVPQASTGSPTSATVAAPAGAYSTVTVPIPQSFTGTAVGLTVAAPLGAFVAGTKVAQSFTGTDAGMTVTAPPGDVSTAGATYTPIAINLSVKASLTMAAPQDITYLSFDLSAKASLNVVIPRPHTVDPVTGLPQYRLVAVKADGTRLGELPNVQISDVTEELGLGGTRLEFTLPKYDATNAFVLPTRGEPIPEVQVWRGPNLESWQMIDGARPGEDTITYNASGLAGYLDGRVVGRTPKTDWLVNGTFTASDSGWSYGYDSGSIPATTPKHSVVTVDFFGETRKALKLSGADKITISKQTFETAAVFEPNSSTFISGGQAIVTSAAQQIPASTKEIYIVGHTAYNYLDGDYGDGLALSLARAQAARPYVEAVRPSAAYKLLPNLQSPNMNDGHVAGRGRYEPLNDNSTYAEQAKNRRVVLNYQTTTTADADSAQWAQGSLTTGTVTVAKGDLPLEVTFRGWALLTNFLSTSKTGYGVQITRAKASAPSKILEENTSTLDETTPTDDWTRHSASITVPADGVAYVIKVRLYAPGGDVLWTDCGVYPAESLHFRAGTDRALVVKGLVEHAQDPAMGKLGDTPILIGTRTPLSGHLTKATYPFHERRKILDAIEEQSAFYNGLDLAMGYDATTRWVQTYSPKRGTDTGVTLALGSNIVAYESSLDLTESATRWIAQELNSSGADREEGIATDLSGLGGVLIERLAYGEAETPVTALDAAAAEAVKWSGGGPIADLTVTIGKVGPPDPTLVSWMLDRVNVGDVVGVDIQDGPIVHLGPHRVVRRILTPDTDTLRYSLTAEV